MIQADALESRGGAVPRPALVWAPLLGIAALRFALPLLSTALAPIGYTADELYYLACADHLAWGYVDHPPFSVAVLAAVRGVLGDSLLALRLVPALCEALAVLVTAALARELGGGRSAQLMAALAMATAPMALAIGLPYSMNPLEHLLWPLAALLLARLQNGAGTHGWLWLGLLLGIALLNKLSTLWLGVGLAVGLLMSPARFWLRTRWPWLAAAIAFIGLAPHLVWQVVNDWPTLEFVRNNATAREGIDAAVVMGSPGAFAVSQLVAMGLFASPLWLFGLAFLFRAPALRAHRALGWTFAVTFAGVALSGRSSVYYLVGAFPIVFAAGGAAVERLARDRFRRLPAVACTALCVQGFLALPFVLPFFGVDRYLELAGAARRTLGADPEATSLPPTYEWMLGGPELTAAAVRAVATLSPSQRSRAGLLATSFGEAGALAHFGAEVGLPPVIGTHNNFWLWGTGELDGSVLIVVAAPKAPVLAHFASCRVASRVDCPHCEPWLRERALFVCEEPEKPLAELWAGLKRFE